MINKSTKNKIDKLKNKIGMLKWFVLKLYSFFRIQIEFYSVRDTKTMKNLS